MRCRVSDCETDAMIRKLRDKRTPDEVYRLLYEWVKTGRCSLRQFKEILTMIQEGEL